MGRFRLFTDDADDIFDDGYDSAMACSRLGIDFSALIFTLFSRWRAASQQADAFMLPSDIDV